MLAVVACASGGEATTTSLPIGSTTTVAPTTTTAPPTTTTLSLGDLAAWEVGSVVLNGTELAVAIADEPGEIAQGLMGVDDLGGLAGMLFIYDSDRQTGFWMKDTIIPLDIAFFAENGSLVGLHLMEPCEADPCPLYFSDAPYRWALETPAGGLTGLGPDSTLAVP